MGVADETGVGVGVGVWFAVWANANTPAASAEATIIETIIFFAMFFLLNQFSFTLSQPPSDFHLDKQKTLIHFPCGKFQREGGLKSENKIGGSECFGANLKLDGATNRSESWLTNSQIDKNTIALFSQ